MLQSSNKLYPVKTSASRNRAALLMLKPEAVLFIVPLFCPVKHLHISLTCLPACQTFLFDLLTQSSLLKNHLLSCNAGFEQRNAVAAKRQKQEWIPAMRCFEYASRGTQQQKH